MIYIIGDSHTRTFSNNPNFIPLFVGAGKEMCFISDKHLANVKSSIRNVALQIEKNSTVMIVLGEPDTRYYLGKGWTPWQPDLKPAVKVTNPYQSLDASLARYQTFLLWFLATFKLNIIVFNVVLTVRKDQNRFVQYMNEKLKKFCVENTIPFIDIQKHISQNEVIKETFAADAVHLDVSVQTYIVKELRLLGLEVDEHSPEKVSAKKIQSSFVYNPKFACYTYQPKMNFIKKLLTKLMVYIHSARRGSS